MEEHRKLPNVDEEKKDASDIRQHTSNRVTRGKATEAIPSPLLFTLEMASSSVICRKTSIFAQSKRSKSADGLPRNLENFFVSKLILAMNI